MIKIDFRLFFENHMYFGWYIDGWYVDSYKPHWVRTNYKPWRRIPMRKDRWESPKVSVSVND